MKYKCFTSYDEDGNENIDSAFQYVSQQVLAEAPTELLQHPSAAPSAILQCLLRLQNQYKSSETPKIETETASLDNSGLNERNTRRIRSEDSAFFSGPTSSLLEEQLSKRGVARKDPLLNRLAAYRGKFAIYPASKDVSSCSIGTTDKVSASFPTTALSANRMVNHLQAKKPDIYMHTTSVTAKLPEVAKHWTRRRLSEMTSISWAIFREQIGIDITPVNMRQHSRQQCSSSASPKDLRLPLPQEPYTVDTVHPVRCWQEARLPFTLGCCLSASYALPTAIQAQCVPLAMADLSVTPSQCQGVLCTSEHFAVAKKIDIIGVAETGTGKTLSYLIPAFFDIYTRRPKLLGDYERIALGPLALIIVPTRELAEQVTREAEALLNPNVNKLSLTMQKDSLRKSFQLTNLFNQRLIEKWESYELSELTKADCETYRREHNMLSELRVVKVAGGEKAEEQFEKLSKGAHIVVGTIGQLVALLELRYLSLGNAKFVVVDEADRMIDEHQQDMLAAVLDRCPKPRQTLLFTATMSRACEDLARKYLSPEGFFVVRTLQRYASIRQNFELIPLMDKPKFEKDTYRKTYSRGPIAKQVKECVNEVAQRRLDRLIYPLKFNRLVTWLIYASAPIIIFVSEKRVCDALQDELQREAEYLANLIDQRGLTSNKTSSQSWRSLIDIPSIDAPPPGLVFEEETRMNLYAPQQRRAAAEKALFSGSPTSPGVFSFNLENLRSIAVVHSELSQNERYRLTQLFHRRERRVLITTDLLSRGLDVPGVALVINYDLPWPTEKMVVGGKVCQETAEEAFVRYIHRIGRTGRAGATGIALSFICLPSTYVDRASSAITVMKSTNSSALLPHEQSKKEKDNLSQRIYPLQRTDALKQSHQNEFEFTNFRGNVCTISIFGNSDKLNSSPDTLQDEEESDRNSDGASYQAERPRKHSRTDKSVYTMLENTEKKDCTVFYSDEMLLKPLWEFLVSCVQANGYTRSEAVEALQRHTYSKIDLPPLLAFIMHTVSTQGGRYGIITR